jgi:hypothetical protein
MMSKRSLGVRFFVLLAVAVLLFLTVGLQAQETTGGLQGTVKDANGAVVPKAAVELTGTSLVGAKNLVTDATGYYRFANLPPGEYTVAVKASGFATLKRAGIVIEVGHLPTLDLTLKVGAAETVVEVTAEAPLIDVATTRTITNITAEVIEEVPHGRTFQSVIQFAPSARNEPLAGGGFNSNAGLTGSTGGTGAGNTSPGNGSNGNAYGFSVAGGADSENSYLVEGQETGDLIGGYSHTNVPFEFIQEVQIKSSGIEAEHGGSLGGVVNVIMKKGGNNWHGELGVSLEADSFDGSPNNYTRVDPFGAPSGQFDPPAQFYQPKKDRLRDVQPFVTIGGAILKDRLWFFAGFDPEVVSQTRSVNFGANDGNAGLQNFSRNTDTYYSNARIDLKASSKLNIFTSYLYQLQRQAGSALPRADSTNGYTNVDASDPLFDFQHGFGSTAPNITLNVGGDFTITPRLVSTTRFGYFFQNYRDFGWPTTGTVYQWETNGTTANQCLTTDTASCSGPAFSAAGPEGDLMQGSGYTTNAINTTYTHKNANKHVQLDQDIAWFKSGWWGTHNFKGGYQMNRVSNDIWQSNNAPVIQMFPGAIYSAYVNSVPNGQYGYFLVNDQGTKGTAISWNHSFFFQDAWTLGHGVTINGGIRLEHEKLPSENQAAGLPSNPIEFGWGKKVAPRIGASWDVFKDGKLKLFGSYGQFTDNMKLNVAISSFGGQWWNNCAYAMNDPNYMHVVAVPDANQRFCTSGWGFDPNAPAFLTSASSNNAFIENINYRGTEGAVSGLKPYRQHENVVGADYAIKQNLAFEVRWDRRRLDHVIEDAGYFVQGSEVFSILNPGEGVNKYNQVCGSACPQNVKPNRNYDGVEFRLNKSASKNWFGMLSYTWSKFRGNYAGLTSTDLSDGGGGRNSPNNSRAFDETYFMWDSHGRPANGLMATDRPNTFKGYAYYQLHEGKLATTNIGWFQAMYQGSPLSTYLDVGAWQAPNFAPVYPEGRGHWADVAQDPTTGLLTVTDVRVRRTPWYFQSDSSLIQEFKVNKNNERQVLGFEATVSNLFNQHSAVAYGSQLDSAYYGGAIVPGGAAGAAFGNALGYSTWEHPYDWKNHLNTNPDNAGIHLNSTYGKPIAYELCRNIRLKIRFTF